jgi:hypothetical protein
MKVKSRMLVVVIISLFVFQSCTYFNSNNNLKIANQELIYDSLDIKGGKFKVNLYTTLGFKKKSITRKEYNDFLLVINKDTFPLIPEANFLKKEGEYNEIKIKYISQINFQSKEYENDSLTNIILNSSKIINSEGKGIKKNNSYNFKSLITFRKIKKKERVDM